MQRLILAQHLIEPDQLPMLFASVAVFTLAAAVIVVFVLVYGPTFVRDVRDLWRERRAAIERADRARLQTVVNIADASRRPARRIQ